MCLKGQNIDLGAILRGVVKKIEGLLRFDDDDFDDFGGAFWSRVDFYGLDKTFKMKGYIL